MRTFFVLLIISALASTSLKAQDNKNLMDSLSYSLGMILADNLKKQGFEELNVQALSLGISDMLGDKSSLSMEDANKIIEGYLQKKAASKFEGIIKEGQEFLASNAERPEVTVTPSGLQYEVLTEGSGPKPSSTQSVKTHYTGMLIDGSVFDSSVERGTPATFPINRVIMGWQEALPMMPVGSKWKIYVPYDLGYGERGAGQDIPPFATLIFEIELIDIVK